MLLDYYVSHKVEFPCTHSPLRWQKFRPQKIIHHLLYDGLTTAKIKKRNKKHFPAKVHITSETKFLSKMSRCAITVTTKYFQNQVSIFLQLRYNFEMML